MSIQRFLKIYFVSLDHLICAIGINERKILTNVADTPDLCDFYLSSIVQKGNLKIAISTNGQSPTMAKRLKEILNETIPNEIDELIVNLNKIRNQLNGDFQYKVKELNKITQALIEEKKAV